MPKNQQIFAAIIIICIKRKRCSFFLSAKAEIARWLQVEAENRIINQDGTFVCAPFKWGVENVIKGIFRSPSLVLPL